MAALELRNKTYRVVFMYAGKKYGYSLDTGDREMAEALRGGVEKTLMLIEQHLLAVPGGLNIVAFLKAGGKAEAKPETPPERLTLAKLTEGYLAALGNGSVEENSLATVRLHLGHFLRSLGGRFDVHALAMDDLQKHVNRRKHLSPVTLKKEMASFRACWERGMGVEDGQRGHGSPRARAETGRNSCTLLHSPGDSRRGMLVTEDYAITSVVENRASECQIETNTGV